MREIHSSICRLCPAFCGIRVEVDDGRVVKVYGDKDNVNTHGYSCKKGRSLPEQHMHPNRLLHPLRKLPDGSQERTDVITALDEIAAKLREIIDRHGPRAVALYAGTMQMAIPAAINFYQSFMAKLGSPMVFHSGMLDQPGKPVAAALHGTWDAGMYPFDEADTWLVIGANPMISMWGPMYNPGAALNAAKARGRRFIVIDPRVTESAERADLHLQIKPGEDATLLAGIIRVILDENLHDKDFIAAEVDGLEELYRALAPYTVDYVAKRCDIPVDQILAAARMFASGKRSGVTAGTGPNMAGRGTLTEYLILALQSVCGQWVRAGEPVFQPFVLLPERRRKAQANPPVPGWGFGEPLRVRNLGSTAGGMPTAALADEILLSGEGQVKALIIVGGNPIVSWPDQLKAHEAMKSLDLLVSLDLKRTQTSKLADYIIPPPHHLEVEGCTQFCENLHIMGSGLFYQKPFAQYFSPVLPRPEGSDLIEEWEFFYELARRLGLELEVPTGAMVLGGEPYDPTPLDMTNRPTSEDVYRLLARNSRISIEEVKRYEHGHLFPAEGLTVEDKEPDWKGRLNIGDPVMIAELAEVAAELVEDPAATSFPFRLISRRMRDFMNSMGNDIAILARNGGFNPAFMNPEDIDRLGLANGDEVVIESERASIFGIVHAAADVRRGTISMAHGFGDTPEHDGRFREIGSPTGRLIDNAKDFDPYTGIPRMSAIPVRISSMPSGAVELSLVRQRVRTEA